MLYFTSVLCEAVVHSDSFSFKLLTMLHVDRKGTIMITAILKVVRQWKKVNVLLNIYIYEHCAGGQTFACFDTELTKHQSSTKDELKGPYIYLNGDVIMLKTLTEAPSSPVDSPCGVKLHLDPCLFRPKAGQLSQFAVFLKARGCGPENSRRLADVRGPSVGLFLSQTP